MDVQIEIITTSSRAGLTRAAASSQIVTSTVLKTSIIYVTSILPPRTTSRSVSVSTTPRSFRPLTSTQRTESTQFASPSETTARRTPPTTTTIPFSTAPATLVPTPAQTQVIVDSPANVADFTASQGALIAIGAAIPTIIVTALALWFFWYRRKRARDLAAQGRDVEKYAGSVGEGGGGIVVVEPVELPTERYSGYVAPGVEGRGAAGVGELAREDEEERLLRLGQERIVAVKEKRERRERERRERSGGESRTGTRSQRSGEAHRTGGSGEIRGESPQKRSDETQSHQRSGPG